MDVSSWKQEFVEDLPEQKNGCGLPFFVYLYCSFAQKSKLIYVLFNEETLGI